MADAYSFLLDSAIQEGIYNIGSGTEVTIRELTEKVIDVIGFKRKIVFVANTPDGTPRKLLVSRMTNLGWKPKITLREGIALDCMNFLQKLDMEIIK